MSISRASSANSKDADRLALKIQPVTETPTLLLATTFLLGVGGPLTSPAWAAMTPLLVEAA